MAEDRARRRYLVAMRVVVGLAMVVMAVASDVGAVVAVFAFAADSAWPEVNKYNV